jgi:methylmalonyl-CoA mutase
MRRPCQPRLTGLRILVEREGCAVISVAKDFSTGSEFPKIDHAAWLALVETEIKGAPFVRRMTSHFYEKIEIEPLFTEESFPTTSDVSGYPGSPPFTRGAKLLGNTINGWDIRQEQAHPDPATANAQMLEDLQEGVTSIDLRLDGAGMLGLDADDPTAAGLSGREGVSLSCGADFDRLLAGVKLEIAGLYFEPGGAFLAVAGAYVAAARRSGVKPAELRGGFNADPLRVLMGDGALPMPLDTALSQMADLAHWTVRNAPNMRAIEVCTTPYHDAGASAVADVAFAIATGTEYLRVLTESGLAIDDAARQITFSIALGCRFYLATAKIRAARRLWADVVAACGGSAEAQAIVLRVSTGRRVMTTRNQTLNILRNTVACYAGAIGVANIITTTPFDAPSGLPTKAARRNARNTHHILKEECQLSQVIDPAGGSWYIEWYTDAIARHAWALFQEIEGQGGMLKAAPAGWVADQIKPTEAAREKDIGTRKVTVVGISEHATLIENVLNQEQPDFGVLTAAATERLSAWRKLYPSPSGLDALADVKPVGGSLTAAVIAVADEGATLGQITRALTPQGVVSAETTPLAMHPYDAAFEALRDAAAAFAPGHGDRRPRVYLAGIGSIAEQAARKGYAGDFFTAGGFDVVAEETKSDTPAAVAAFTASGAKIAVICSTDKQYAAALADLVPKLKAAGARNIVLAGNPGPSEAAWRALGVDAFIYVRCDVVGTLWSLLHAEGVAA